MSYNQKFTWPKGASNVIVTGTFDNWTGSIPLVKTSSGDFEITIPLKTSEDKVLFKFIVDGDWTTSKEYETLADGGNENNVIYPSKVKTSEVGNTSKIPEAGGLSSVVIPADTSAFETKETEKKDESKDLKTTVLPSSEGKQSNVAGEPGIAIPSNANEIEAFSQVRDVDAKELNEKLNKQETTSSSTSSSDGKSRKIKVKKIIKRNKITGEEIVVSTEPIDEDAPKSLDPKKNSSILDADTTTTTVDDSKTADTANATTKTTPPSTTATPTKKPLTKADFLKNAKANKTAGGSPSATPEKEKKGGFFGSLKKFL